MVPWKKGFGEKRSSLGHAFPTVTGNNIPEKWSPAKRSSKNGTLEKRSPGSKIPEKWYPGNEIPGKIVPGKISTDSTEKLGFIWKNLSSPRQRPKDKNAPSLPPPPPGFCVKYPVEHDLQSKGIQGA